MFGVGFEDNCPCVDDDCAGVQGGTSGYAACQRRVGLARGLRGDGNSSCWVLQLTFISLCCLTDADHKGRRRRGKDALGGRSGRLDPGCIARSLDNGGVVYKCTWTRNNDNNFLLGIMGGQDFIVGPVVDTELELRLYRCTEIRLTSAASISPTTPTMHVTSSLGGADLRSARVALEKGRTTDFFPPEK